jgi:hypothetical protein
LEKYRFRIQALNWSYSNKNFCTKSLSQSCHQNRIQKVFQFRFRQGKSTGSDRIWFLNTELALKHFLTQLTRLFFKTNADILLFASQNNIEKKNTRIMFLALTLKFFFRLLFLTIYIVNNNTMQLVKLFLRWPSTRY